jgi:hypothetical protein
MCADSSDTRRGRPGSDPRIAALLGHPGVWRAGQAGTGAAAIPTGFAALDQRLPGGGWPAQGLIDCLVDPPGTGELGLLLPVLAALQQSSPESWLLMVSPPHEPYAPALVARGIDLHRLLVTRTPEVLWTLEQALRSMACRGVVAWMNEAPSPRMQDLRRLQLAAMQSGAMAVLCRPCRHAREPSPAVLRLVLEGTPEGLMVRVLKSRGGSPGSACVRLQEAGE